MLARAPLFLALLLYFVLTAALLARVPLGAAPDEAAHAEYIQAIVEAKSLPTFAGQEPPKPGYEFHQPPLFYLVAAPLWAALGAGVENYAARALSLLFGLATVWVVWRAARLVFGLASLAPALCVLGAALSPLHQGVGAGINNDALAGLWSASLFYLVARAWLETPTSRLLLGLGCVAGLGALTKLTALPLGLWAFVAVGFALQRQGQSLGRLLPALGVAFALALPMLARNQLLYGDPFGYVLFSRAATQGTPGFAFFSQETGMDFFTYARGMVWQILMTAWGFFGGPNAAVQATGSFTFRGPQMPGIGWLAPLLVVVATPLIALWNARQGALEWNSTQGVPSARSAAQLNSTQGGPPVSSSVAPWWALGVALLFVLWLSFAYGHISGGQARYLHGALLPLCVLLGGGLARNRTGLVAAGALGLTMLGLSLANIVAWKTLV